MGNQFNCFLIYLKIIVCVDSEHSWALMNHDIRALLFFILIPRIHICGHIWLYFIFDSYLGNQFGKQVGIRVHFFRRWIGDLKKNEIILSHSERACRSLSNVTRIFLCRLKIFVSPISLISNDDEWWGVARSSNFRRYFDGFDWYSGITIAFFRFTWIVLVA